MVQRDPESAGLLSKQLSSEPKPGRKEHQPGLIFPDLAQRACALFP